MMLLTEVNQLLLLLLLAIDPRQLWPASAVTDDCNMLSSTQSGLNNGCKTAAPSCGLISSKTPANLALRPLARARIKNWKHDQSFLCFCYIVRYWESALICNKSNIYANKITFRRTRSLSNVVCFKRDSNVCAYAVIALILFLVANLSPEMYSVTALSCMTRKFNRPIIRNFITRT